MATSSSIAPVAPTPLFPLFADLRGRTVLVVGGGVVARRKVLALLEAGAAVALVAPALEAALRDLALQGRVRYLGGTFAAPQVDGAWLVVAASRSAAVNREVAAAAKARNVFVNVLDDATVSSVHVPARVKRGGLQVAISSGGAAPVLARRVRERIEAELDAALGDLVALLARERAALRDRFPVPAERRRFIERWLDSALARGVSPAAVAARDSLQQALVGGTATPQTGRVALVGAGPGDPGLLTLKALRALQDADVIVHDRLIGPAILDLARRDAERIDVGKRVGEDHDATQARIHMLLMQHARAGRRVVRLQGGDPLVFGRAGEELDFLRSHGIAVDVIPGITAALGCAAAAGIALTDRRHAHRVTLLSPRGGASIDGAALAAPGQTLAVYMGVGQLEALAARLIEHGLAAATPSVLVERGTLPGQRVLAAPLGELAALARAESVAAPALLIVGEVAAAALQDEGAARCSRAGSSVSAAA